MRIDVVTIFPELVKTYARYSIIKKAIDKQTITLNVHNLRDYSNFKNHKVDDYPYGGGAGMVMMIEPIALCIEKLKSEVYYDEIILLSPSGQPLSQGLSNTLSLKKNVLMLCGHYKGVDERVITNYVTKEISIGDYVLTGGELPALVLTDSIVRLLPGVLSDIESALHDSFQNGLLSEPVYTRPYNFKGNKVPDVLLSGDHARISQWRFEKALEITKVKRPDLFETHCQSKLK